jgi:hypothetical protein
MPLRQFRFVRAYAAAVFLRRAVPQALSPALFYDISLSFDCFPVKKYFPYFPHIPK